jgi:hypothetical protein
MERSRKCLIRSASWMTALALAFLTAGGRASGEASSAPAVTLERAAALVQSREFARAAAMLQDLLSADPANRRASELLGFALESLGDIKRERRVRSALAAEFPGDPRVQADYGRVLERSGDEAGALRAYRHARELSASGPTAELDAAIERMKGRTAPEVGAPLAVTTDPGATSSRVQAGAAVACGSGRRLALLGTRYDANSRSSQDATASAALALSFVRHGAGASWTLGPRLHVISPRGARTDVGAGGAFAGRAAFGRALEAEGGAGVETPWDEAPIAVLHGGRTTAAEGHLYSPWFSRRLLLQIGARRRRLSILNPDSRATRRPEAWQSLWVAGADVILWTRPGAAVRGEMLDEALVAPTTLSSAFTLGYRHYDESTRTSPEFAAHIGLAPRASVDEASVAVTLAPPQGRLGIDLRAGLADDSARGARAWRAGGAVIWAPESAIRFALGYEQASEVVTSLVGLRRTGWLSFHVDL